MDPRRNPNHVKIKSRYNEDEPVIYGIANLTIQHTQHIRSIIERQMSWGYIQYIFRSYAQISQNLK